MMCVCVAVGMIVAVPAYNSWHRAQVVSVTPGRGDCDVKFVDYGGYSSIPLAMLRQIRCVLGFSLRISVSCTVLIIRKKY